MTESLPHIGVCVCTYRRPDVLRRCLDGLQRQLTNQQFTYSITVVDNDHSESARAAVADAARVLPVPVVYCVEPKRNIALARNRALANARGEFRALIDDDEVPAEDWLLQLLQTCRACHADGVLGPVKPLFETPPPAWIVRGRFYDRPIPATGAVMKRGEPGITGNVLFRRSALDAVGEPPFRPEFGTGGEDVDFFRRMLNAGRRFVWCREAVVQECIPSRRCRRRFLLRRALLRGGYYMQSGSNRVRSLGKSLLAVPLYTLALPVLFLVGDHVFMQYLVRLCDHGGRLLALVGLNPVRERDM